MLAALPDAIVQTIGDAIAGRIARSGAPITVKPITVEELAPLDIEPLADIPTLTTFHMTQEGDSFWSLAKSDLGPGASNAAIQARAQQYMEVNAGVDPRSIPTNYFLTVPGDGVTVSAENRSCGMDLSPDRAQSHALGDEDCTRSGARAGRFKRLRRSAEKVLQPASGKERTLRGA
jgi:hypothetical protein